MIAQSKNKHTTAEILKTEGIFRFDASQTLSQTLSKLHSSHDAAFVFDSDKFVGVVSPYYIFASRSINAASKLKSVAKIPPKLYSQTSLSQVAQAMIDSKIYFLPVLNKDTNEFLGIATAQRLFDYVVAHHLVNHRGVIIFSNDKLITVNQNITISQVLSQMNQQKITKIPVVDEAQKLVGIISQYDLKTYLQAQESSGKNDRRGEKQAHLNIPIKEHMKKMVVTMTKLPHFEQAVDLMIEHRIGSLVIIDRQGVPQSFVTKRDLLNTIATSSI